MGKGSMDHQVVIVNCSYWSLDWGWGWGGRRRKGEKRRGAERKEMILERRAEQEQESGN